MIRTFITPTQRNFSITLDLPDDYLGHEVEVIVFKKEEGLVKEKTKKTMAGFWGTISDETASELHKELNESRNGWEERSKKQL